MSALDMSAHTSAVNDELNDLFGEILHGRASVEQIATFERKAAEFQDALCEASTEQVLAAANAATDARGLPRLIPAQRYCWACDAAFETTDPRQQNCDQCIAHYRGLHDDQDAIVGPPRIDREQMEAWEESRARDFDVTDEIPF